MVVSIEKVDKPNVNMELLLGRREAAEFLGLTPPQKVIDVATGTGTLAYELAKLGHSVIGIDSSSEAITQAKIKCSENLTLRFERADAADLPYGDGEFDASAISFALHDMPHEASLKVLGEMKRVTKPNGRILVVDYNEPRKHWAAKLVYPLARASESTNFPPFIHRGLDSLLQEINLRVSRETTFLGVIQIVVIDR